jgi:hypothetical protein
MNMALEAVLEVTFHILDSDVIRFSHDPLVGIGILYLPIMSQTLNRCGAVKWLTVVQLLIVKLYKYTVYVSSRIISKHHSANLVFPVFFNLYMESPTEVENSDIFTLIPEGGEFDTSAQAADMSFSRTLYLL